MSLTRVPGAHAILVSEMADAFALFRSCDCRRGAEETGRPGQTVSVSLREEKGMKILMKGQDPSSWAGRGQVLWCLRACSALMVGPDTVNVKQEPGGHGQPQAEKSELVLLPGLPKLNDALLIKLSSNSFSLHVSPA